MLQNEPSIAKSASIQPRMRLGKLEKTHHFKSPDGDTQTVEQIDFRILFRIFDAAEKGEGGVQKLDHLQGENLAQLYAILQYCAG